MSVNRYEFEDYGTNEDDGRYVTYEDYAALEARCAALAAENACLMQLIDWPKQQCPTTGDVTDVEPADFIPSTSAFLAEVRASALEYYANLFKDTVNMDVKHNQEFHKGTLYVADQFRKGVQP
ncbi:hypothetical protein [Enterobacter asburiae]